MSSLISAVAFVAATIAALAQFLDATDLVWLVGLLTAGFAMGARSLISDVLMGISLLFEDTYSVGEKVELLATEGVVEAVNLRTTLLRSESGELLIIPNGDVRLVRNYSRGSFSTANVLLKVSSPDLERALQLLEDLGQEAVALLPNLLEPWQVVSETGRMGQVTELMLVARARFGMAAEMRPRLLTLVQSRLTNCGIELAD